MLKLPVDETAMFPSPGAVSPLSHRAASGNTGRSIELFRQEVEIVLVDGGFLPIPEHLIFEGTRHLERWVTRGKSCLQVNTMNFTALKR